MVTTVLQVVNNSVNRFRTLREVFRDAFFLVPLSGPKSGIRPSLVKPSLVHSWSNILGWRAGLWCEKTQACNIFPL